MVELIKQSEWAERHGFSRQYVAELVQKGVVKLVMGMVDPEQADSGLASIRDHYQPLRRKTEGSSNSELSTLLLKTRIKNEIERGKILENRVKTETGELISVE